MCPLITISVLRFRAAERKWRRYKSAQDFTAVKAARNHTNYIMTAARKEYLSDFILRNSGDQAKLFQSIKSLLCEPCKVCFPPDACHTTLANEFGKFFEQKIDGIHKSLEALSVSLTSPSSDSEICTTHAQMPGEPTLHPAVPCKLSTLKSSSTEEMQELITRSPIIVQIVYILLPFLTSMVDLSIMSGHFPDALN